MDINQIDSKKGYQKTELIKVAQSVMNSLCEEYQKRKGFSDAPRPQTGLIFRCAGSISLLLLMNTFREFLTAPGKWEQIVIDEFEKVCEHIQEEGFDVTPFLTREQTEWLFGKKATTKYYYIDSVSWVLSFGLLLRLASRQNVLKLSDNLEGKVLQIIRDTLNILAEAICDGGGWGFSNGCTKPDLYYSYAVSESLGDFGDYVLGELGFIEEDLVLKEFLGKDLVKKVQGARLATYSWLKKDFLTHLGREPINPFPKKEDEKASDLHDHNLLYYTYFVIEMLIVNSWNYKADPDWGMVKKAIEHGIYLSRIGLDRAKDDKDEYWENPDVSSLRTKWENHPETINIKKGRIKPPKEPGLVPLSLRCNVQYAYFIAEGPDKKIDEMYELVRDNRHQGQGLWDTNSYDLLVTERAVEALVDYYDYLFNLTEEKENISLALPESSQIDSAIREIVRTELSTFLTNINTPQKTPQPESMPFSEAQLMPLFRSMLAGSNQVLSQNIDSYGLGKEPDKLIKELKHTQKIIWRSVINQLPNSIDKERVQERWEEEWKALLKSINGYLQADSGWQISDLFKWVVDKYTNDQQATGNWPKK